MAEVPEGPAGPLRECAGYDLAALDAIEVFRQRRVVRGDVCERVVPELLACVEPILEERDTSRIEPAIVIQLALVDEADCRGVVLLQRCEKTIRDACPIA